VIVPVVTAVCQLAELITTHVPKTQIKDEESKVDPATSQKAVAEAVVKMLSVAISGT